jgi:PIN domain nuclease of toxin-antitoxin system
VILLDTHVLVWATSKPARLSRAAAASIQRAKAHDGLAIAAVSLYETAHLLATQAVRTHGLPSAWLADVLADLALTIEELTPEIALVAAHFPPSFPADPFDRIIAATARVRGLRLVTADARIQRSGVVETIW